MYKNSYRGDQFARNNRFSGSRPPRRQSAYSQNIADSQFISQAKEVFDSEVYVAINRFEDFPIAEELKARISQRGYVTPTPIQDKTIPFVLEGEDVVGIAQTGTGKTGAFLIPLINKTLLNKKEKVLIMVPTRELALQIEAELREFAAGLPVYAAVCVGGQSINAQMAALRRHPQFVIGTPGRL